MLNYIWAGLIVFSLVFALMKDFGDIHHDTYRNGQALPVTIKLDAPGELKAGIPRPVHVLMNPAVYRDFYHNDVTPADSYAAVMTSTRKGAQLQFSADSVLIAPLTRVRDATTSSDDKRLGAEVVNLQKSGESGYSAGLKFPSIRFQMMADVAKAGMDSAKDCVMTIALPLIGVIALWLGITRIGEQAGLIAIFNKLVRPILKPLFPEVPDEHPAMGFMALNLTANILGMGNAATPMGLKAMEELQSLNAKKDTATNAMVMLLAMHASSIQLLPPVMVIAILGLRATNELLLPIWLVSGFGLCMGIIAAILAGKLPGYRATDPARFTMEKDEDAMEVGSGNH